MPIKKLSGTDVKNWYKALNIIRTQSGIGLSPVSEGAYSEKQTTVRAQALVNNILSTRNSNTFLRVSDYGIASSNISDGKKIRYDERASIQDALISLLRICVNQDCATVCTNSGTNSNQSNSNTSCTNGMQSNSGGTTSNSNGINSYGRKTNGYTEHLPVTNSNGTNSYGTKSNGCSYVVNEKGTLKNGTNNNGSKSNTANNNGVQYIYCGASNGYDNTNNDGTHMNGTKSNGTNKNKTCSNGDTVTNTNSTKNNGTKSNGTCSDGSMSLVEPNNNGVHSFGTCTNGYTINECTNGWNSNGKNTLGTKSNGCKDQIYQPGTATYAHKDHYSRIEAFKRAGGALDDDVEIEGPTECALKGCEKYTA